MNLSDIRIYPVKSLAGIRLSESQVKPTGLDADRMFMLVDEAGVFITQRKYPRMALINTRLDGTQLTLIAPGMSLLTVDKGDLTSNAIEVSVWRDTCFGSVANLQVNQWLSKFLGISSRLVSYDNQRPRASDPEYSKPGDIVSFADGFPLLVISEASLNHLNSKLDMPVSMTSFRPNIVIAGCESYAEDTWSKLRIGEVEFDAVKPCSRCILTTVDPDTGIKRADGEPLKTLSQYRRASGGVMFGMNLIPRTKGAIRLNDSVEIIA